MARPKRGSVILEKATRRSAGMQSIGETLELGNGLSLTEYNARIQVLQTHLSSYNTMLSTLDEMAARIALLEQELGSYSEKMLMSVGTRYGKNSLQYMQAGGRPRKRSTRVKSSSTTEPTMITNGTGTTNGSSTTNGTKATVS